MIGNLSIVARFDADGFAETAFVHWFLSEITKKFPNSVEIGEDGLSMTVNGTANVSYSLLGPEHQHYIDHRNMRMGRPSKLDRYKDKLGVLPDEEVAELAGVSMKTVFDYRGRLGLQRVPLKKKIYRRRIDPYIHMLGTVPDDEIAKLSGLSVSTVRKYRTAQRIQKYYPDEDCDPPTNPTDQQPVEPTDQPEE